MTSGARCAIACVLGAVMPVAASSDIPLGGARVAMFQSRDALVQTVSAQGAVSATRGSLFAGREDGGLFAAPRAGGSLLVSRGIGRNIGPSRGDVEHIRHIIASAEAGSAGYDAVQHGARIKPRLPPTSMTLQQIFDWIRATPGQPHAIGRYQFIPKTLARLVNRDGAGPDARFTPALQDRLADLLLEDAGLLEMRAGEITRHRFMNNLSRIWAGLPNSSGRSHYEGYAGNKATMTWARFNAEMARIFPG